MPVEGVTRAGVRVGAGAVAAACSGLPASEALFGADRSPQWPWMCVYRWAGAVRETLGHGSSVLFCLLVA